MKHVYVVIHEDSETIVAVCRKRKRIRKEVEADWARLLETATLVWSKGWWMPYVPREGDAPWTPYRVEKHGVL